MLLGFAAVHNDTDIYTDSYQLLMTMVIRATSSRSCWLGHYGTEVAVKVINKSWQRFNSLQRLFLEVQSMKVFNYLNNIKLFEMYLTYKHSTWSGCMLADVWLSSGPWPYEKEACNKFFCGVSTVQCCFHQMCIVHRDLEPENLLFWCWP